MKPMQRPNPKNFGAVETIPGTSYPKPKHVVPNESTENHGITFSIEPKGNAAEGDAELEVLKCILCREGYLKRLMSSAKTVGKKFKPEVADILDLVRAASVDLVEAIVRWREIKGDHDSAYMWNGVNYLIKMPSDLDFLSDYLAIKKWMGFRLERNPFCIPFPMEDGAQMFSDRILDPQHIDDSSFSGLNHDFVIGGMNLMTMSRKYIYTPQDTGMLASPTKRKTLMSKSMDDFKSPYAVPQRVPTMFVPSVDANKSLAFEDSSMAKNARKLAKLHLKDTNAASVVEPSVLTETTTFQSPDKFSATASSTRDSGALIPVANSLAATSSGKNSSGALMRQQVEESFILNNDMKKIRQCELVLLKEEEKFGRHKRDPEGRIIPALQADTLILAKELALDNRRPIGEKARTSAKIATHAAASDVGVEEERWMPDAESAAKLAAAQSKMLEKSDEDAVPRERGKQKIGGHLNPIKAKGAHSKSRIPLIPNLAGEMEFNRARRKQTLGDRLNEIAQLRDKIQQERQALEDSVAAAAEAERRKQRKMVKKPTKSEMLLSRLAGGSSSLSKKPDESHMLHSMSMTSLGSSEGQTGVVLSQTLPNPLVSMDDATAEKNTSEPDADSGVRNTFSADSTMRDHNLSKALADISIVEGKESSIDSGGIEGSFGTGSQESGSAPTTPSQDLQRKKYEEVQNRITEKLQELDAQGTEYATELEHITKIDKKINKIKVVERKANNMEKSREIERKRRNLTEKEAVRKGPPPDELANQYDYYSTRIQKMIRGFVGRRFVARYRIRLGNAVAKIQAGLRGLFSRNRVRRLRREFYCATYIQKNFRGWKARVSTFLFVCMNGVV